MEVICLTGIQESTVQQVPIDGPMSCPSAQQVLNDSVQAVQITEGNEI